MGGPTPKRPDVMRGLVVRLGKLVRFLLLRREGRLTLLGLVLLAVLGGAPYWAWRLVGERVLAGGEYRLRPENIELVPPLESAPWIRRNVTAEVLRDASLDHRLSLVDDDLVRQIYQAFAMHPWVARVERVTKRYPARLRVELVFRRPVAMVDSSTAGAGLWPVDVDGYVLPADDFSPVEMQRYPRITAVSTVPAGPVGSRWGDVRVVGGARIAHALGDAWHKLNLARIVPVDEPRDADDAGTTDHAETDDSAADRSAVDGAPAKDTASDTTVSGGVASDTAGPCLFQLLTKWGTRIHWGRPPGESTLGEPTTEEKLARLQTYADQFGSLDEPHDAHELDVRQHGNIVRRPRAAAGNSATRGSATTPRDRANARK